MADLGIRSRILVKDVMTSPVITIGEDETVDKVGKLMDEHKIGCVIVHTKKSAKPVGVITERDLVTRVVAKNLLPSTAKAKEIMSAPLVTIDADKTISEAARRMNLLNIRRLGVMYKGNLVGIISSKDILSVTPELIEIIQEKARMNTVEEIEENPPSAGYCDACGAWSDSLREVEGSFLCEECQVERSSEE